MDEVWKLHTKTGYEVSSSGRVRKPGGEPRKTKRIGKNYVGVNIVLNKKHTTQYVHRMVLETFVGEQPSAKHEASHINGDRQDNRLRNLVWESTEDNARRRIVHGTSGIGSSNAMAKLNVWQALMIKFSDAAASEAADLFSVSAQTIRDIRAGRTWRALDGSA